MPVECSVCFDDAPLGTSITISENQAVCTGCIKSSIIPIFHDALKFEINYPVKWSGEVELHPEIFARFFDDFKGFIGQWKLKFREYETAASERVYCRACDGFLFPGISSHGFLALGKAAQPTCFAVTGHRYCAKCRSWACDECGLPGLKREGERHICNVRGTDNMDDPFKDLIPGKDYQRCPRASCRAESFLQDGCNATRQETLHRGGCPKFNQPGSKHALFAEEVEEVEEIELARAGAREGARLSAEQGFLQLIQLPAFETTPANTTLERLQQEQQRAPALLTTRIGALMLAHRWMIDRLHHRLMHHLPGPTPDWRDMLLDVLMQLDMNLDVYIFPARTRIAIEDFTRRHNAIMGLRASRWAFEVLEFDNNIPLLVSFYDSVARARLPELGPR